VATGDDLDIEQPESLLEYLRAGGRIGPQEQPRLQRLPGGVSSRAMLVEREAPAGRSATRPRGRRHRASAR